MTASWLRRSVLAAVCATSALLAACGSSTVESAVSPSRLVVFGDGQADLGQNGSRYTVNDGSANVWVAQFASLYGVSVAASSAGGTDYATGNARITQKPDAAGVATTRTVKEQIDAFLASGSAIGASDVFIVSAGTSDLVSNFQGYLGGSLTSAQLLANATTAGQDLATQVRRLVTAGAKYVLVTAAYNMSRSPWAIESGKADAMSQASLALNNAFEIAVSDLGSNVLYVDGAYYYNLLTGLPGNYSLTDGTTYVCNSVDAGAGIGTGTGQVNSALCNTGTIKSGLDSAKYVFADRVYFTPQANRLFGTYARDRFKARF